MVHKLRALLLLLLLLKLFPHGTSGHILEEGCDIIFFQTNSNLFL